MQLSITPLTSIRPLGEEHLRMFRRTTGHSENAQRVITPKEAERVSVFLSEECEKSSFAPNVAMSNNARIATLTEAVMDLEFLQKAKGFWVHIDRNGVPNDDGGYYQIDRKKHQLVKISPDQAGGLLWHDTIFINQKSVIEAAKQKRPLALDIGEMSPCLTVFLDRAGITNACTALVKL